MSETTEAHKKDRDEIQAFLLGLMKPGEVHMIHRLATRGLAHKLQKHFQARIDALTAEVAAVKQDMSEVPDYAKIAIKDGRIEIDVTCKDGTYSGYSGPMSSLADQLCRHINVLECYVLDLQSAESELAAARAEVEQMKQRTLTEREWEAFQNLREMCQHDSVSRSHCDRCGLHETEIRLAADKEPNRE